MFTKWLIVGLLHTGCLALYIRAVYTKYGYIHAIYAVFVSTCEISKYSM
jgi:hypothetical protein